MKKMYKILTKFYTINLTYDFFVQRTWMFFVRRGGRLGVTNQGWSRVKSFLQETEDKFYQHAPRNGVRQREKSHVQDARERLADLPFFFLLIFVVNINCQAAPENLNINTNTNTNTISNSNQNAVQGQLQSQIQSQNQAQNQNLNSKNEANKQQEQMQNEVSNKTAQNKKFRPLDSKLGSEEQDSDPNSNQNEAQTLQNINPNRVQENPENFESPQLKKAKKKIRDVAELYEKQFLRDMVKQMRATVPTNEMFKASFAEGYFREQLDQEYVEKWGDKGGIGLGDMIYNQLLDRYGDRLGVPRGNKVKPTGPFPIK